MASIIVLGAGLQGRAALYDLALHAQADEIIAADFNTRGLDAFISTLPEGKVRLVSVDARSPEEVRPLLGQANALIMLLPASFGASLAPLAIEHGVHWVDASYALPEYHVLDQQAASRNLAILPEFGLDPGIDLVLAAKAIREFDTVHEFFSYGAGIPDPKAADNPLNYKISWSLSGVLRSYVRPARLVQEGKVLDVPAGAIFAEESLHQVEVQGVGRLEAYPNGDVVKYLEALGLTSVRRAGRYTMRWPGHAAFWDKMTKLGFLDDSPRLPTHPRLSPRDYLHDLLEPQLNYAPDERDLAIVRVEVSGIRDGRVGRLIYEVVDRRDLESGFLAMQRTVGFTASIGAQMILRGDISRRGLLSPARDVPADMLIEELGKRGVHVRRSEHSATPKR